MKKNHDSAGYAATLEGAKRAAVVRVAMGQWGRVCIIDRETEEVVCIMNRTPLGSVTIYQPGEVG